MTQDGQSSRSVHDVAAAAVRGPGRPLPHRAAIQRAFGRHDVGAVQAYTGVDRAARQLGARAFATGSKVAFAERSPGLHVAAHEAAHVIQQRGGVSLSGGVGEAGDRHERHADAVADAVVAGRSAEALLDSYGGGGAGGPVVQRTGGARLTGARAAPARSESTGPEEPRYFKVVTGFPNLAGMARPGYEQDNDEGVIERNLAWLFAAGYRTIIALDDQFNWDFVRARWEALTGVYVQVIVEDYSAPTVALVEQYRDVVEQGLSRGKVVTHCAYGAGRTGTMIAGYWALRERERHPLRADDAYDWVTTNYRANAVEPNAEGGDNRMELLRCICLNRPFVPINEPDDEPDDTTAPAPAPATYTARAQDFIDSAGMVKDVLKANPSLSDSTVVMWMSYVPGLSAKVKDLEPDDIADILRWAQS
ncbi:MAG: DUF4157 domain-containing protein [Myxococcales bacterium]|nr:DUF4157 domain-containing protein [Myxococcales bacterium]